MAILCINCGKAVPEEDARFCNNCGTSIPPHSPSPRSSSSTSTSKNGSKSPVKPQDNTRPGIREQIAYQPPPRPVRGKVQDGPSVRIPRFNNNERSSGVSANPIRSDQPIEDEVDNVPTSPLITGPPTSRVQHNSNPPRTPSVQNAQLDEVEQLDTTPLAPSSHRKPRSRNLLIAALALLLFLLLGGLGVWVVVVQPFSVSALTQPQQSFNDSQLNIALLYPNSWKAGVDQSKATAHFYDSSHTDQVTILMGAANGRDVGKYLQQEATQLGITGVKPEPTLSFAGATWQQMQGSVQQRGANYTETLLATVHNNRLYTIMQLAPQATYADEETAVFSSTRSSFQFLS